MEYSRIEFLGMPLNTGVSVESLCDKLGRPGETSLITFVNPQSWAIAKQKPIYLNALRGIDFVLPDGASVSSACRKLTGSACQRISFDMTSLAEPFFKRICLEGATVALVGGKPGVVERVAEKLTQTYSGFNIIGLEDGFGDIANKAKSIVAQNPKVIVVGMGVPYQELMLVALKDAGFTGIAITCGGFFDQYLQSSQYYPAWIDKANLRFAYRLYKEPGRLWRRYFLDYQLFVWRFVNACWAKIMPR